MECDCFWSKSSALGNTKPTKTELRAQRMGTERPGSFWGYSELFLNPFMLLHESKIYSFLLLSGILLLIHSPVGGVGEIKKAGQEKRPLYNNRRTESTLDY